MPVKCLCVFSEQSLDDLQSMICFCLCYGFVVTTPEMLS